MTGDSWSCLLHGAVIQVTRGCTSGRGETPGSHWVHLHLPDKPGQRGAVWAPHAWQGQDGSGADGCLDHRGHAKGKSLPWEGCWWGGDIWAALLWDSLRVNGVDYSNVLSPFFMKSIFSAGLLCKGGASPWVGSQHQALLILCWERKPLLVAHQPPHCQRTRGREWIRAVSFSELSSEGRAAAGFH